MRRVCRNGEALMNQQACESFRRGLMGAEGGCVKRVEDVEGARRVLDYCEQTEVPKLGLDVRVAVSVEVKKGVFEEARESSAIGGAFDVLVAELRGKGYEVREIG